MTASDYVLFVFTGTLILIFLYVTFDIIRDNRNEKKQDKSFEERVEDGNGKSEPEIDFAFSDILQRLGAPELPYGAGYVLNESPHDQPRLTSIDLHYKGEKHTGYVHLTSKDFHADNVFVLGAERAYENFVKHTETGFDEKYFKSIQRAQAQVDGMRDKIVIESWGGTVIGTE